MLMHIFYVIYINTHVCVCTYVYVSCRVYLTLFFAPLNKLNLFERISCYSLLVITFIFWTSKLF